MKKAIMIVPHALYLPLLAWGILLFIELPRGDYGLMVPALIFIFTPLPSAISAVGLMIANLVSKSEKNKGIPIAYGVLGSLLLILYVVLFFAVARMDFGGIFYLAYVAAGFVAPFCLVAIWVLWIIRAVKSRKSKGGFKYIPNK